MKNTVQYAVQIKDFVVLYLKNNIAEFVLCD